LKRKALSLTRAELELSLQVENSNAFSLLLNQFNYDFQVNNRSWAIGKNSEAQAIDAKKANSIKIPMNLNFLEMGTVAYQLLTSKAPLNYRFAGQFDFGSSEPFLKSLKLPVDYTGSLKPPE
jgi:LEA14-like dessication related protein